jgi:HEAT repeat protein
MTPHYPYLHEYPYPKLAGWWEGLTPIPDDFNDWGNLWTDEVAYGLSMYEPEGIELLKSALYHLDIHRRSSAIEFLSKPELADDSLREALMDAYYSGDPLLIHTSMRSMVRIGYFPLTKEDLESLEQSMNERLAARAMVYRVHAHPEQKIDLLKAALRDTNPRLREYACDVVGDHFIQELREDISELVNDPHPDVRDSARCNLEMFEGI